MYSSIGFSTICLSALFQDSNNNNYHSGGNRSRQPLMSIDTSGHYEEGRRHQGGKGTQGSQVFYHFQSVAGSRRVEDREGKADRKVIVNRAPPPHFFTCLIIRWSFTIMPSGQGRLLGLSVIKV